MADQDGQKETRHPVEADHCCCSYDSVAIGPSCENAAIQAKNGELRERNRSRVDELN